MLGILVPIMSDTGIDCRSAFFFDRFDAEECKAVLETEDKQIYRLEESHVCPMYTSTRSTFTHFVLNSVEWCKDGGVRNFIGDVKYSDVGWCAAELRRITHQEVTTSCQKTWIFGKCKFTLR